MTLSLFRTESDYTTTNNKGRIHLLIRCAEAERNRLLALIGSRAQFVVTQLATAGIDTPTGSRWQVLQNSRLRVAKSENFTRSGKSIYTKLDTVLLEVCTPLRGPLPCTYIQRLIVGGSPSSRGTRFAAEITSTLLWFGALRAGPGRLDWRGAATVPRLWVGYLPLAHYHSRLGDMHLLPPLRLGKLARGENPLFDTFMALIL